MSRSSSLIADNKSYSYFIAGVMICLLGATCFSTKAIFVKLAYRETTVDAVTLLALRMIFSLPFFVASAWWASSKSTSVSPAGNGSLLQQSDV